MLNNILLTSTSIISDNLYYVICAVLTIIVLVGIHLMSKVKTAVLGNRLSALAMFLAVVLIIIKYNYQLRWILYISIIVGGVLGLYLSKKIKMIQMPQMVALLNGVGGAASGIVAIFAFLGIGASINFFNQITALIAVVVGFITLLGSLIAAGKLHKILPQKPLVLKKHELFTVLSFLLTLASIALAFLIPAYSYVFLILTAVFASLFGIIFTIRVGGADMPITISLLNSLSGVAGAIAGMAIGDVLLVAIGGIVGASGLLLTKVMCKAMNRSLIEILLGKTTTATKHVEHEEVVVKKDTVQVQIDPVATLKAAKKAIIVPGYGMALAQAQYLTKQLADKLKENGASVKYAIHPVAGRMPGHMNVLLAEANVDYDELHEMEDINPEFKDADVAIVVGANDVLNPAANHAEDTPIYGMPILNVEDCPNIIIFNYDLKAGYAGVDNPLYTRENGISLQLGNAADTLSEILKKL